MYQFVCLRKRLNDIQNRHKASVASIFPLRSAFLVDFPAIVRRQIANKISLPFWGLGLACSFGLIVTWASKLIKWNLERSTAKEAAGHFWGFGLITFSISGEISKSFGWVLAAVTGGLVVKCYFPFN